MSGNIAGADQRKVVALASRVLAANGHNDYVWGHAALRDLEGRGMWMKSSGLGFDEITPDDVVLIGWDGSVLAGSGPAHMEWPIHAQVMAHRADVHGTVHSHPPHAIALAAAGCPLLPVSHAATAFVPPEVPRYDRTTNLILTTALGDEVAEKLGESPAMLLVNHGIVAAGPDLPGAVVRAILLEDACHQQLLVNGYGGPRHWTSDEEALQKRSTIWTEGSLQSLWLYLVRTLPDVGRGASG